MTTSNKVSWSLVAVLSIAVTKMYFINKHAEQSVPAPVEKSSTPPWEDESMFPSNTPMSAYKGTIQVNKIPFPFNVNGSMPYQVWVDGERVPLKSTQSEQIIDALELAKGKDFVQPENTAEIHAGAGWQVPLPPSIQ